MDRIRDIMEPDVITVLPEAPVSELAALLDRAGITGAPVVDADGMLVGMITVRDVVRLSRDLLEVPEASRWGMGTLLPENLGIPGDLPLDAEFFAYYVTPGGGFVDMRDQIRRLPDIAFDGYQVRDIMSPNPVTIASSTLIRDAARTMLDARIHRCLVVDDGVLKGIVTATDLLRTVAER